VDSDQRSVAGDAHRRQPGGQRHAVGLGDAQHEVIRLGRHAERGDQVQAALDLVHWPFRMLMAGRQQRPGAIDRGGRPEGDVCQVAKIGRRQGTLTEGAKDDGTVVPACPQRGDHALLAGAVVGQALPGIDPRRFIHDHAVDVGIEPAGLRPDGARQEGHRRIRQRRLDGMDGRRGHQHITQVIEPDGQDPPRCPPALFDHDATATGSGNSARMRPMTPLVLKPSTNGKMTIRPPSSRTASASTSPSGV
jgi:hypothetical protein